MSESVAVVPASRPPEAAPLSLIHAAIEKGVVDPEYLKKLLDLQERWEDRQAQGEFNRALNAVQAAVGPVLKRATNEFNNSKYAKLEDVLAVVQPASLDHGFSISFGQGECPDPQKVRIYLDLAHVAGCTKRYEADIPLEPAKGCTPMQVAGKAFSYGRRYLLGMVFNLRFVTTMDPAVRSEDNDGQPVGRGSAGDVIDRNWQPPRNPGDVPRLDIHQSRRVSDLLARSGRDVNRFLAWVTDNARRVEGKDFPAVAAVGQIPAEAYQLVMETLERAVAQKGGGS